MISRTTLLGNSIGANMFMLGQAYQAGFVPLSSAAIRRAIELNGEAVAMNLAAFDWVRAAYAERLETWEAWETVSNSAQCTTEGATGT